MRQWVLLFVIISSVARADEDACCCDPAEQPKPAPMDPVLRDELITGTALFAIGHTIALITQMTVPASTGQRVFDTLPVFGTIDAIARSPNANWDARMTLVFATGVQLVGILMVSTAAAVNAEQRPKRTSWNGNAVNVHF